MPEIANFVNNAAASITPAIAEKVLRQLPQWKLEFTQINAPKFPHLVDQLEFLADAVEDAIEGLYKDLPLCRDRAGGVRASLHATKKMASSRTTFLNWAARMIQAWCGAVLIRNERPSPLTPQPRASTGRKSPTSPEVQPPTPAYSSFVLRSMPMST